MADSSIIPRKMRALQYDPSDQQAHINVVDVPKPQEMEILVRITCASLCHSDCLVFRTDFALSNNLQSPTTLGHEATGVVLKTGNRVMDFENGDRVGFLATGGCFACRACITWSSVGCASGVKAQGFTCDGYFQEFVVVDARTAVKLPPETDALTSSPLCCAGVTAYNAVKQCNLAVGEAVAIIGVGGVGQMGVQYAKAMGLRVIAVDKNDYQLKTAEQLGADDTINPTACPAYPLKIKTLTKQGVDAALNFTADIKVYDDMPSMLRYGGVLMVVGVVKDPLRLDCMDLISQRYVVKAACNGLAKDLDECIRFSAKHKIKPVVEFRDLEDIPAAIAMMEEGKLRHRVCVKFSV